MREADQAFEKVGGATRHFVRDCLLPALEAEKLEVISLTETPPVSATPPELTDGLDRLLGEMGVVDRLMARAKAADHLCEIAWGVIANSGGGNWKLESEDWQTAAANWRAAWFAHLDRTKAEFPHD